MDIIIGVLEEGFIYAIIALGLYISYKILDFPDMTVDGSFPLGGAVTAYLLTCNISPIAAMLLAALVGAVAGIVTGIIHVKFHVRDLLSGIIVMTGLYSINLRIAGKANVPLFSKHTIFNAAFLNDALPAPIKPYMTMIIIFVILIICKLLLDSYLKTKSGYLLRAVGDNATLVTSIAKDKGLVKIVGLSIANSLAALGGSVYVMQKEVFDINMGTGTVVIALASVIIGTKLFANVNIIRKTTAVIIGSVIYKACVSVAISLGMPASDLKLIMALLFLAILVIGSTNKGRRVRMHA